MTITGQAIGLAPQAADEDVAAGLSITAQALDLTGDGHGHHVAGTPMVYKHGFIPIGGTELGKDGVRRPGGNSHGKSGTPPAKAHPALTTGKAPAKPVSKSAPAAPAKANATEPQAPKLSAKEKQRLTSMWTSSYRYSGTSYYAGTDRSKIAEGQKRGQEFAGELHRLLATNKPPQQCGAGCQDAHKFLAMADQDSAVQHKEMQRGLDLPAADAKRLFQPGKTLDMPAASWTTSPDISKAYAGSEATPGKTRIILHTAPPAKGLDLQALTPDAMTAGEGEVVTGGRYSVESVKTTGGVMHVYVTQKDFSAH